MLNFPMRLFIHGEPVGPATAIFREHQRAYDEYRDANAADIAAEFIAEFKGSNWQLFPGNPRYKYLAELAKYWPDHIDNGAAIVARGYLADGIEYRPADSADVIDYS